MFENFLPAFSPDPTQDCPWVSEDVVNARIERICHSYVYLTHLKDEIFTRP